MTALVARPPLHVLSTSAMQIGSRRSSTRLQEKVDAPSKDNAIASAPSSRSTAKDHATTSTRNKKRKNDYDEEDDGFEFTRVNKNKKSRQSKQDISTNFETAETTRAREAAPTKSVKEVNKETGSSRNGSNVEEPSNKKRKKMSFSTPKAKEPQQSVRRSKRLSNEVTRQEEKSAQDVISEPPKLKRKGEPTPVDEQSDQPLRAKPNEKVEDKASVNLGTEEIPDLKHSSTKIALPFADTPVIRRNKAMREGKSVKGDRRSSLGLRGRRASSLIEAGSSNALPHQEVDPTDFYKHIESDLMEPRRMRQLLTWCATRAMHAKPKGTDFEDASAKSAARVVEEELLKELSSRSELSDWFSREVVPEPPKQLPERPNPKNVQNLQKIAELEERIQRLKLERDALQQLLQPSDLPELHQPSQSEEPWGIDRKLLSEEDAAMLDVLNSPHQQPQDILQRINWISSGLGPSIDIFADGIHKVAQYRIATDGMAGKLLSICADRLDSREKEGRRKALHVGEDRSPGRDLSSVLRSLSKAER